MIDDDDQEEIIQIPSWWEDTPWIQPHNRITLKENIPVQEDLLIKRIVLLYDEDLPKDEIEGHTSQYSGVQLLRNRQWIETVDLKELIPSNRRGGFRGFVEFDNKLDGVLRDKKIESPTHERFYRYSPIVKEIDKIIQNEVREFAEQQGWSHKAETRVTPKHDQMEFTRFLRMFTDPVPAKRIRGGVGSQLNKDVGLKWECQLSLDFPKPKSARVDWGQSIKQVSVSVECDPPHHYGTVDVTLEMMDENGTLNTSVATRSVEVSDGRATAEFGEFKIITGNAKTGEIQCLDPGKWQLRAKVEINGEEVASAKRHIYVHVDPPTKPNPLPQTISVNAVNISRLGERRINNGDKISVRVTVTNRSENDARLKLTARLGDHSIALDTDYVIKGVPIGDVPNKQPCVYEHYDVYTSVQPKPDKNHLLLESGLHQLVADLKEVNGEVIAHASQPIYIEVDPSGNRSSGVPFELQQIASKGPHPHPMWELQERSQDDWVLSYPGFHPLYEEGHKPFIFQITAEAILEWSLLPLSNGDDRLIQQLKQKKPNGTTLERWEIFCDGLDQIQDAYLKGRNKSGPDDYMGVTKLCRKTVAGMVEMGMEMN